MQTEVMTTGVLTLGSRALAVSVATKIVVLVSFPDACFIKIVGKTIRRM